MIKFRIFLQLIGESFFFAWGALRANVLRTALSLLGVSVGIFLIIGVFTMVDSLERQIKDGFSFLGTNNINVEKWPYGFGGPYPWWKYLSRPQIVFDDYKFLKENVKEAEALAILAFRDDVVTKYKGNSANDVDLVGFTYDYFNVVDLEIVNGRYFTQEEGDGSKNVAIIGAKVAKDLFMNEDPINKTVSLRGQKLVVIGVLKEEGEGFLGLPSKDDDLYVPYSKFLTIFHSGKYTGLESIVSIKGKEDDPGLIKLEGEVTGLMRIKRGLKPREENDFAVNRTEALNNALGSMFDVLTIAGWVIGSFSILVGGFGIANIMFVSVKERTSLIGIQKSLGAKDYFILMQFLFEAVFLSLLGGLVGLFFVYLLTFLHLGSMIIILDSANVILGISVSVIIGILSGIIPAIMAANMDPVEAIRAT